MNNSAGSVVVTGGLGYIGSHLVETLQKKALEILILDKAESFKYGPLPPHVKHFKINLADHSSIQDMAKIFCDLPPNTTVIHLAAEKSVEESIKNPEYYERENVEGTRNLLAAMSQSHLDRMIFSSTAAVYGDPIGNELLTETQETRPLSPYAKTKLLCEKLIISTEIESFRYGILRFFNVAGASRQELIERDGKNLIPILLSDFLNSKRFTIFGNDYPTLDGTCVRDFVDVRDLVDSIVICMDELNTKNIGILNIGSGSGYSVLQVIEAVEQRLGSFKYDYGQRRLGDPSSVVADITLAKTLLGWTPKFALREMIESVTPDLTR